MKFTSRRTRTVFSKYHVGFLLLQQRHGAGDVQRRDALTVPRGDGGDGAALLADGETLFGAALGGEIAGGCRAAAAAPPIGIESITTSPLPFSDREYHLKKSRFSDMLPPKISISTNAVSNIGVIKGIRRSFRFFILIFIYLPLVFVVILL